MSNVDNIAMQETEGNPYPMRDSLVNIGSPAASDPSTASTPSHPASITDSISTPLYEPGSRCVAQEAYTLAPLSLTVPGCAPKQLPRCS